MTEFHVWDDCSGAFIAAVISKSRHPFLSVVRECKFPVSSAEVSGLFCHRRALEQRCQLAEKLFRVDVD